jgi:hypothetical protein
MFSKAATVFAELGTNVNAAGPIGVVGRSLPRNTTNQAEKKPRQISPALPPALTNDPIVPIGHVPDAPSSRLTNRHAKRQ